MNTKLIIALILAAVIGVLIFWGVLQSNEIKSLREAKNTLEANNNLLVGRIRKEHADKLELSKRQKELEDAINSDTSGFDWDYNLTTNRVLLDFKRMHAR